MATGARTCGWTARRTGRGFRWTKPRCRFCSSISRHASLDEWMYVTDTSLARQCGVDGYYVRVAEPDQADAASSKNGFVPIKNRPPSESTARGALTVSPDALAFVRFGVRAPDDPRRE